MRIAPRLARVDGSATARLIADAYDALYRAKAVGRNRVAVHGGGASELSEPLGGVLDLPLGDDRPLLVDHANRVLKSRGVTSRWASNKRLRCAITTWADNSRHEHAWAQQVYSRARERGCGHPHAVRILARAWCRVLWRCWHDHPPCDLARHYAARHFAPPDMERVDTGCLMGGLPWLPETSSATVERVRRRSVQRR